MMSTWLSVVSLLLTWIVSSRGLNITVLVIRNRVTSPSEFAAPEDVASNVDSVSVYTVDDISIFAFWQTDYKTLSDWLIVMDTRTQSCPYQLFQKRLLGYISLYPGPCDLTNMTSVLRVQMIPFDYRHLVVDVGNYSGSQSNSVAFLFDESGREYQEQVSMSPFQQFLFYLELTLILDEVPDVLVNLAVKTDVRYVFVMAPSSSIEHVLLEAKRLNMLWGRYHWLLFATDGVTPRATTNTDHSILLIKDPHNMLATNGLERLMRLFDDVIKEMTDVISALSSPVCDCVEPCGTCKTLFRNSLYKMAGSSAGVFLREDMAINSVDFKLYNYNGNETEIMQVATWSEDGGLVPEGSQFVGGSNKVVLRVAAVVEPPFVFRNESGGYYGYSIDVLDAIADIVGFTYTVKECDDGHYGLLNADGVWTGCISNIINGDSDIIAGAMTVTADREAVVDFTLPYYDFAGIQIVMKKRNTAINLFYFADVFTPLAWLCLGAVIAVTSLLLMLLDRYAPSSRKHEQTEEGEEQLKTFDLKESIWFVMGSLTMTGAGAPPHSFSARLLVAGFWFFSVIMMSTFTANLAAFLTVSRMGVTISSLSELAGQVDIKYSVVSDSTVMTYFQRMAAIETNFYSIWKEMSLGGTGNNTSLAVWDYPLGDKYVNIWNTIQATGLLNSTEQAVSKIKQENFAYIADSPVIKYLTYKHCELTAIGDMFSIRPYAFALKEKSIYTKKISSAILELQKGRMLEAFKRRWWDDVKRDCPESSTDQGLDLKSLTGSFIVVAVGIASGLLILTMEHFWNRCSKKKIPVPQLKPRYSSNESLGDVSRTTDVTVVGDQSYTEELSDLPEG